MRYLILVLVLTLTQNALAVQPAAAPQPRSEEPLALTPLQPDKAPEKHLGTASVGSAINSRWVWKNAGTKPLQVESIEAAPPFSVNGKDCAGEWPAGKTCDLTVRYEPKEPGAHAGTIRVSLKSGYEETQLLFRVSATATRPARVEIDGDTSFGNALVGQTQERSITIRNTGEIDAANVSLRVSGNAFQGTGCATKLAPGENCTAKLRFTPREPGGHTGTVTVQFQNGAPGVTAERSLAGAGLRPARLGLHMPGSGNLGRQILGTTAQFHVALTNTGDLPAKNLEVAMNWSNPFSFRGGKYPGEGGDCGKELAPRSTCRLSVQNAPLFPGPAEQAFAMRYSDGAAIQTTSRTVKAEGITPARLSIREKSGEFDQQLVQSTLEQRFHLVNDGQGEATGVRIVPTSGFTKGFELKGAAKEGASCGTSVAANSECEFTVRFSSKVAGNFDAGVTIFYQNGISEQAVKFPFRAKALGPASLAFEPATPLDFGEMVLGQNRTELITLHNVGDVATEKLVVSPMELPFTFKWDKKLNREKDVCGQAVHGGRKCLIEVAYAPTVAGNAKTEIKMTYFDGLSDRTLILPVRGKGLRPASLELTDKGPVDFGVGLVTGSADRILKFKNTGDIPAVALNTEIPGGQKAAFFNAHSTCTERLDAGKECTVKVGFAPPRKGVLDGELKLTYSDGKGLLVATSVPLKGEGRPTANLVLKDQQKVDFGHRLIGQTETVLLTLANEGETPASKIEAKLTDGKKGFNWKGGKFPGDGGECPIPLEPGKSCKLAVAFSPTAAGELADVLSIQYDNGAKPAKLASSFSGRATPPGKLELSTAALDFGTRVTGSKSVQAFDLKNTGGDELEVALDKIELPEGFSFKGGCGKTLSPGKVCRMEVEFAPVKDKGTNEKIRFVYNDKVSAELKEELTLKADAKVPAQLTLSPPEFTPFGAVFVGDNREQLIQIKNVGGVEAPLEIGPAHTPGFTLSHTCPARLAPGASCAAKLKFIPDGAKKYEDKISLSFFDGLQKRESELAGAGEGNLLAELKTARKQVDFGRYPIGKGTSRKVKIENAGTVEAKSLQATSPASPFRWQGGSYPGTDGDCGATLAPGAECSLSLEFLPVAATFADGQVEVRYNDGRSQRAVVLDLKGQVEAPPRDISSDALKTETEGNTTSTPQ